MLTFLSSVCSVSSEAATASRAGLRKHWKGVVRFISPLLVNLISSLAIVINRNTAWLSERRCFATQTGYIYEWTWERSVTKQCFYVSAYFFKWVYANPWPSLVGIQRIPAYHIDYTTARIHDRQKKKNLIYIAAGLGNPGQIWTACVGPVSQQRNHWKKTAEDRWQI